MSEGVLRRSPRDFGAQALGLAQPALLERRARLVKKLGAQQHPVPLSLSIFDTLGPQWLTP